MRYSKHISNTWLLAHAIHPILFCCFLLIDGLDVDDLLLVYLVCLVAGMLISLPLLAMWRWLLPLIIALKAPPVVRLQLWCVVSCGCLLLYCGMLLLLINGFTLVKDMLLFLTPSLVATFLAIVFRLKAFDELCTARDAQQHLFSEWNELISQPLNTTEK